MWNDSAALGQASVDEADAAIAACRRHGVHSRGRCSHQPPCISLAYFVYIKYAKRCLNPE